MFLALSRLLLRSEDMIHGGGNGFSYRRLEIPRDAYCTHPIDLSRICNLLSNYYHDG